MGFFERLFPDWFKYKSRSLVDRRAVHDRRLSMKMGFPENERNSERRAAKERRADWKRGSQWISTYNPPYGYGYFPY